MRELVLATRNPGKLREIRELLFDLSVTVRSLDDFPDIPLLPEKGASFEENALAKARAVAEKTGLPALGDDSGLEVEALGGQPGVSSARYSGGDATDEKNIQKLLREMKGLVEQERKARFVCVLAIAFPGGEARIFRGQCDGIITEVPRGSSGFGYDPVFFSPSCGGTFGEIDPNLKNQVSHRARAFREFKQALKNSFFHQPKSLDTRGMNG